MRTAIEWVINDYMITIPRFEPIPQSSLDSISLIKLERRAAFLNELHYLSSKCEAWSKHFMAIHDAVNTQKLIKRIK